MRINLVLLSICFCACASHKGRDSLVGVWNYTVYETLSGDVSGSLVIAEEEQGYTAHLITQEYGEVPVRSLELTNGELKGFLDIGGAELPIYCSLKRSKIEGYLEAVDGKRFILSATRQQKE